MKSSPQSLNKQFDAFIGFQWHLCVLEVHLYVDIDMKSPVFTSMVGLLVAMAISAPSSAQIRVVSYNSAQFNGDANAMSEVLLGH